jgi:hypothetical protein
VQRNKAPRPLHPVRISAPVWKRKIAAQQAWQNPYSHYDCGYANAVRASAVTMTATVQTSVMEPL